MKLEAGVCMGRSSRDEYNHFGTAKGQVAMENGVQLESMADRSVIRQILAINLCKERRTCVEVYSVVKAPR